MGGCHSSHIASNNVTCLSSDISGMSEVAFAEYPPVFLQCFKYLVSDGTSIDSRVQEMLRDIIGRTLKQVDDDTYAKASMNGVGYKSFIEFRAMARLPFESDIERRK